MSNNTPTEPIDHIAPKPSWTPRQPALSSSDPQQSSDVESIKERLLQPLDKSESSALAKTIVGVMVLMICVFFANVG